MFDRGIVYLVFGREYDKLAAHTIAYSRQFTDLPITVLTNVLSRSEKWGDVPSVSFVYIPKDQSLNRAVKTSLPSFTPYKKTLYLDCDSVIQIPGVDAVFDMLDGHDIVLNQYMDWKEGDQVVHIARDVMWLAGVTLPLTVYCGAFICWDNTNENVTQNFFPMWNKLWVNSGRGREMFQMCCAAKQTKLKVRSLTTIKDKMFSPNYPTPDCVVQHNYNSNGGLDFHTEFNLPRIQEYKPFDQNPLDWTWVDFEEGSSCTI